MPGSLASQMRSLSSPHLQWPALRQCCACAVRAHVRPVAPTHALRVQEKPGCASGGWGVEGIAVPQGSVLTNFLFQDSTAIPAASRNLALRTQMVHFEHKVADRISVRVTWVSLTT